MPLESALAMGTELARESPELLPQVGVVSDALRIGRGYSNRPTLFRWGEGVREFAVYFHDRWPGHASLTDSAGLIG